MTETPAGAPERDPLLAAGASALGWALIVFSAPGILAPRLFGRLAGLTVPDDGPGSVALRSVAIRDVVMGAGLVSSGRHGGRLRPWLLARILCDGGDTLTILLALARGPWRWRLAALGVIALGATAVDAALYGMAEQESRS